MVLPTMDSSLPLYYITQPRVGRTFRFEHQAKFRDCQKAVVHRRNRSNKVFEARQPSDAITQK
jgi:hypothetical protein